jgi:hypothetical protein
LEAKILVISAAAFAAVVGAGVLVRSSVFDDAHAGERSASYIEEPGGSPAGNPDLAASLASYGDGDGDWYEDDDRYERDDDRSDRGHRRGDDDDDDEHDDRYADRRGGDGDR